MERRLTTDDVLLDASGDSDQAEDGCELDSEARGAKKRAPLKESFCSQVARYLSYGNRERDQPMQRRLLIESGGDELVRALRKPRKSTTRLERIVASLKWQMSAKLIVIISLLICSPNCANSSTNNLYSHLITPPPPHQQQNYVTQSSYAQNQSPPPQFLLAAITPMKQRAPAENQHWPLVYYPQTCSHPNHASGGPHYHHHHQNEPQHYHFNIQHLHEQIRQHLQPTQPQPPRRDHGQNGHDVGIILRRPTNKQLPPDHNERLNDIQRHHGLRYDHRQLVKLRPPPNQSETTAIVLHDQLNLFNRNHDSNNRQQQINQFDEYTDLNEEKRFDLQQNQQLLRNANVDNDQRLTTNDNLNFNARSPQHQTPQISTTTTTTTTTINAETNDQQRRRNQKQTLTTTDIDECLDERACGKGAICENLPGSFKCSCPQGFTGDPTVECFGK